MWEWQGEIVTSAEAAGEPSLAQQHAYTQDAYSPTNARIELNENLDPKSRRPNRPRRLLGAVLGTRVRSLFRAEISEVEGDAVHVLTF